MLRGGISLMEALLRVCVESAMVKTDLTHMREELHDGYFAMVVGRSLQWSAPGMARFFFYQAYLSSNLHSGASAPFWTFEMVSHGHALLL